MPALRSHGWPHSEARSTVFLDRAAFMGTDYLPGSSSALPASAPGWVAKDPAPVPGLSGSHVALGQEIAAHAIGDLAFPVHMTSRILDAMLCGLVLQESLTLSSLMFLLRLRLSNVVYLNANRATLLTLTTDPARKAIVYVLMAGLVSFREHLQWGGFGRPIQRR
jgi:hypothetical protein